MSSSEPNLNPTIRSGTRADIKEITRLMTRSFARDPMENWFGDVRKLVSSADTQDKDELAIMRKESYFQEMLVRRALMVGEIDVIVIPDGKGSEKIVAVTMWLKPGAKPDPSILQYHKIRVDKVLFRGWGLKSILRVLFDYLPAVEKANKKAFAGKGKSLKDKWHLLVVATDPAHEGHGYTSLMMRKRFEQTAPLPIVLESSSPKSRNIYKHFGFEINEECEFSRGTVDEFGVRAKGEKAVGVKFWVMTKWEY